MVPHFDRSQFLLNPNRIRGSGPSGAFDTRANWRMTCWPIHKYLGPPYGGLSINRCFLQIGDPPKNQWFITKNCLHWTPYFEKPPFHTIVNRETTRFGCLYNPESLRKLRGNKFQRLRGCMSRNIHIQSTCSCNNNWRHKTLSWTISIHENQSSYDYHGHRG